MWQLEDVGTDRDAWVSHSRLAAGAMSPWLALMATNGVLTVPTAYRNQPVAQLDSI